MTRSRRSAEKAAGVVELLEDATSLLRKCPIETMACYYIGTIPFLLAILWFWADMSRSPDAVGRLAGSALGLAVLFIWMKVFQARFSIQLMALLGGYQTVPPITRTIMIQGALQPWAIIMLPVTALLTIPFAWCYALFHNISSVAAPDIRAAIRQSRHLARLWPMQNHLILLLLFLVWSVVFINISMLLVFLPELLKTLFGIETMFSRSSQFFLNSTFWFAVAAMTHLCIDPLVKAAYVLRCHYGEALATGADLRAILKGIDDYAKGFILLVASAAMLALFAPSISTAAELSKSAQQLKLTSAQLDSSLDKALRDPRFSWRIPTKNLEEREKELPGFIQATIDWLKDAGKTVGGWIQDFVKWIERKLPKPGSSTAPALSGTGFAEYAMPVLYGLMALLLSFGAIYAWRNLRLQKKTKNELSVEQLRIEPNLADESVTADELTEDRWSELARELFAKGEIRLALRALYLATLASLGEAHLIAIARFKTNRDYERELGRFAHAMPELADAFSLNIRIFEQAWYGMHKPDDLSIRQFIENHRRISSGAITQ